MPGRLLSGATVSVCLVLTGLVACSVGDETDSPPPGTNAPETTPPSTTGGEDSENFADGDPGDTSSDSAGRVPVGPAGNGESGDCPEWDGGLPVTAEEQRQSLAAMFCITDPRT
ncbi:hypothetical protein BH24ACT8_BH24ACT8_17380 [soil metagenome]